MHPTTPFDSMSTIQPDTNLTGWISNDVFFKNKPQALLYASQNKTNVRYYYNDHVFASRDWSIQPAENLPTLYRARAQELRNKYDYVVLLFSGGSDSTNMVKTFINNDISPDEVISYGAWNHVMDKMDPCNIEITLAAGPVIEMLGKRGTKFTYLNLFDAWPYSFRDEEWILSSETSMALYGDFVNQALYNLPHLRQLADRGKRVCFVWGLEKSQVFVNKGWYYLIFKDQIMQSNHYGNCSTLGYHHETFYSDVTCGDIIAKQVHVYCNYIDHTVPINSIMDFFTIDNQDLAIKNSLFYGDTWDPQTFSLGKNKNQMHSQKWASVASKMSDSTQYQTWYNGVKNLFNSIDSRFINHRQQHFKQFHTAYPIRPIKSLIS
jgi:hypothetical protein